MYVDIHCFLTSVIDRPRRCCASVNVCRFVHPCTYCQCREPAKLKEVVWFTRLARYTMCMHVSNVHVRYTMCKVHILAPRASSARTGWGTKRWSLENMHVAVCRACLRGVPSSVIIAAGSYKLRPLLLVCSTQT